MDLLEGILTRQSIRRFTGEPLSPRQLETVIRAGMSAPSAHGRRPWRFLTVEDRRTMLAIRELGIWWKMLDAAAVTVVVCADPAFGSDMAREYEVDGCAAAMQNMLLAAHGLGLGGVWLGLCEEDAEQVAQVKKLLNIPSRIHVLGMAALGVPKGAVPSLPERFESEKWMKERWE